MGGLAGSIVGGLFSLGGAALQAGAASDAAEAQAGAAREAMAAQQAAIGKGIETLKEAEQKAYKDLLSGYNISQATAAPYNLAGLGALDAYLLSVGISPPSGGSFSLQQALKREEDFRARSEAPKTGIDFEKSFDTLKQTVLGDPNNMMDQWDFGYYDKAFKVAETLTGKPSGTWSQTSWGSSAENVNKKFDDAWAALETPENKQKFLSEMQKSLSAVPPWDHDTGLIGFGITSGTDAVRKFISDNKDIDKPLPAPPTPLSPEDTALLEQYRAGQFGQQAAPGDTRGLQSFFGSPEYQALYGTTGPAADPNATPLERFQKSPGYEFQLQEGVNAIQRASGPKGLMESGNILREINTFGTGLANQEYNNYQTRLQNVFGRYQANLAGLTSLGAGFTAAQSAQDYAYGTDVSQVGLGTAANIASLHQSLGKSNAEALMAAGNASAQGQLASGAAWASGLSGFGSSLANAFQQQPMSQSQQWSNPLPAGQVAFGNSSILGAFAPSGFF